MTPTEDERLSGALRAALAGRRVLVMAVGNPMRADDGFGSEVAARLRALLGRAVPGSWFRVPGSTSQEQATTNQEPGTSPSTSLGALSLSKGNQEPSFPPTVIDAGTAPENFTGVVRRERPEVLLVLDAADFGGGVGELRLLLPGELSGGSPSTHAAGLGLLFEYLRAECGAESLVLAVQAGSLEFGAPMTTAVAEAVGRASEFLIAVLASGAEAGGRA